MNKIAIIFISLFLSIVGIGQNVNFKVQVPGAVELGEVFNVTYQLNNDGRDFKGPTFQDFDYLGGPYLSTSSSTQIINGSMSQSYNKSFTYQLRASKIGKFTIAAASIVVDGKRYNSNSAVVEVVKGNSSSNAAPGNSNQNADNKSNDANNSNADGLIFGRTIISKNSAYVGEPILVTQKIYSKKQIANITDFKEPSYTGFWKEMIDIGQLKLTKETYNNQVYNVVVIQKMIIFPQNSGTLQIGSFNLKAVITIVTSRKPRDQWEQWMYGNKINTSQNTNVEVNSPKQIIKVKPLPEKGKPNNFNGIVGNYTLTATVDKNKVNANDALNLKISLKGSGNIDLLDITPPDFPSDFEVYDPKISTKSDNSVGGVSGSKTWEYLIIPRKEGKFEIPAISFSYFDVNRGSYVNLKSNSFNIEVAKGKAGSYIPSEANVDREDIKYLNKDILYIKTDLGEIREKNYHFFNSFWHIIMLIIIPLITIILIILNKKFAKQRADVVMMKTKTATRVARKRLTRAKKLMDAGENSEFYVEISKVLWGYLSDKFSIPLSELSMDNLRTSLSAYIDAATIEEAIKAVEHCEYARFAPIQSDDEVHGVYDESLMIISKIEKIIK
ncbi:MAG: hypothetical protein AUJ98_01685 [Bacteroidetes bacterium CG2_30_33_31]|nr:MAG: hypothetical protein AUJ98_01685 [Bacteroidetes bacterium CG2_30_33_31]